MASVIARSTARGTVWPMKVMEEASGEASSARDSDGRKAVKETFR